MWPVILIFHSSSKQKDPFLEFCFVWKDSNSIILKWEVNKHIAISISSVRWNLILNWYLLLFIICKIMSFTLYQMTCPTQSYNRGRLFYIQKPERQFYWVVRTWLKKYIIKLLHLILTTAVTNKFLLSVLEFLADPSGRAVWGVGLQPLACWDCGFKSFRGHGCLLWVLCVCQVEVSTTGWSLVKRSPTDCVVSLCVISKPQEWGG
jgi:hypothetical protein